MDEIQGLIGGNEDLSGVTKKKSKICIVRLFYEIKYKLLFFFAVEREIITCFEDSDNSSIKTTIIIVALFIY